MTFIGCSSDNDVEELIEEPVNEIIIQLVEQKHFSVDQDGNETLTITSTYEYSEDNKVSKIVNNDIVNSYTYNENGRVIRIDFSIGGFWEWRYTNNILTSSNQYSTSNGQDTPTTYKYYYDDNMFAIRNERFVGTDFSCELLLTNDTNGNTVFIDDDCGNNTFSISLGVALNPEYLLGFNDILNATGTNKKLETEITVTGFDGNGDAFVLEQHYEYILNEFGYPTEMKIYTNQVLRSRNTYTYEIID